MVTVVFFCVFVLFQNYLNAVLCNPLLANTKAVKEFLDSKNYTFNLQSEEQLQNKLNCNIMCGVYAVDVIVKISYW